MLVREAALEDLQALAALDRASVEERSVAQITYPRPGSSLLDLIRSSGHPNARCYVAVDQETGEISGFALADLERITWNGGETLGGYLFHFRVHPDHRRRGIGSCLAAHGEKLALSAGARLTWVGVVQGNEPSRALFRNLGYGYGSRIEYRAVPLFVPLPWLPARSGRSIVRPVAREDMYDVDRLQEEFWRGHQLWSRRRYSLASQGYVLRDGRGEALASAVCFEQYRVAEVRSLGMKGLPGFANRLLAPLANRVASRYIFVRDLAFLNAEAALDLPAWLVARYRGEADFLVVGADTRSEAQRAIRRLPGLSGWVDVLVKTDSLATDASRPYHMVLG